MNGSVVLGWGLAVAAVAVGYAQFGWPGVALGVSAIVFWLLLQFTRALRAMRMAGQSPVGQVPSVVMVHARMRTGMRLLDIIQLTRALGEKVADDPETWRWSDNTGSTLTVLGLHHDQVVLGHIGDSRAYRLRGGQLEQLLRPAEHGAVAHDLASHVGWRCAFEGEIIKAVVDLTGIVRVRWVGHEAGVPPDKEVLIAAPAYERDQVVLQPVTLHQKCLRLDHVALDAAAIVDFDERGGRQHERSRIGGVCRADEVAR